MSTEIPSRIEQLLAAPRRRQRKLAQSLGLARCIEEGLDAYFAPFGNQVKTETLLDRLYHWLLEDPARGLPVLWPERVRNFKSRFYRETAWEKAGRGFELLCEAFLAIPVLGPLAFILMLLVVLIVGGLLYVLILPFPFLRNPVNRYFDTLGPALGTPSCYGY